MARVALGLGVLALIASAGWLLLHQYLPGTANLAEVRQRVLAPLNEELKTEGLRLGAPVFIRIFKENRQLEVWVKNGAAYKRFRTYDICAYSGNLGPKLKEGDRQAPEGFYAVGEKQLNPASRYHLAFNLGYPNAYDRAHGRTGSFLMVHGKCLSIGCYAMTDPGIEQIYLLVDAALKAGQTAVPVHIFPFAMTDLNLERYTGSKWLAFWKNLQDGYLLFETSRVPPSVSVVDGDYRFKS